MLNAGGCSRVQAALLAHAAGLFDEASGPWG
jgi:hypothetical protein